MPLAAMAAINQKTHSPQDFVQFAKTANFKHSNTQWHSVQLNGVDYKTLWFTDRPGRKAGWIATQAFIKNWMGHDQKPSADFLPNATLVGHTKNGKEVVLVMTLTKPQYNATKHSLTYQFKYIYQNKMMMQQDMQLNHIAIFVDAINITTCINPFCGI